MREHPRTQLNPAFTNPLRFSLMATLAGVTEITFKDAREYLQTTDPTLSKHSSALEELGLVQVKKSFVGKRPQTRLALTKQGQRAWQEHLAALRAIAEFQ
ncbi:transcriptional regulator [Corynebacterium nasicanis]|uniref:Transcriptional regulator n=1 Tax=Corynebacterium nasicanis TaxID=1448267 RepID=A0ABW1QBA0_9CORY